jgi:hypothetical protein
MLTKITSRLSYSNVMATVAVFAALGGGAYAAVKMPKNSVGSAQLKRNAVSSSKVKDRSLLARDFKRGQLPAGAQGPQGPQGVQGIQGEKGEKGDKGDKGETGTVDTSNFYSKGESDARFVAKRSSGVVDVPAGGAPKTLLTAGPVTFTATCDDLGGPDPDQFMVRVLAQSSETPATLGRSSDEVEILSTPTEIDSSSWSVPMVRQSMGAVVTPTTAFNVIMTRGVYRGGTGNCFAGVTVLP